MWPQHICILEAREIPEHPGETLRLPRKVVSVPRKQTMTLTALGGPQGHEVAGTVHLAQTLHLHLHLVCGVRLQNF